MHKGIIASLALCLILSGCSSKKSAEYDQVDLIIYQTCIDKATGGMKNFIYPDFYMDNAIAACKKYLPVKK